MATTSEVWRRRGPEPLVAAALSAVWPGLGHFGHNTGRALLLINSTLAATVAGLAYAATRALATLLTWTLSRPSLQILMAGALCVLVLRVAVTVDAYRTAAHRRPPRHRSVARRLGNFVALVLVFVIIVAPHVIAVRFAVAQLVLLSRVFDATDTQTATATPVPTTTLTGTPGPAPPEVTPETSAPALPATSAPSMTVVPATTTLPTWDGASLAQFTGLDIQYYVPLDMQGFVGIIDLFGGIDVHMTETINDRIKPIVPDGPHIDIVVEPGDYRFDGVSALGYVRSRTKTSDYHRMTRQRCVVGALIDQVTPAEVLANYLPLTRLISDHITTDIPLDRLDELIVLGGRLDTSRIVTVNFIPPVYPRDPAPIVQVREAVTRALRGTANETNSFLADSCRRPE